MNVYSLPPLTSVAPGLVSREDGGSEDVHAATIVRVDGAYSIISVVGRRGDGTAVVVVGKKVFRTTNTQRICESWTEQMIRRKGHLLVGRFGTDFDQTLVDFGARQIGVALEHKISTRTMQRAVIYRPKTLACLQSSFSG